MGKTIRKKLDIPPRQKMDAFCWLFLFSPLSIWFNCQPLIRLGQDSTMHFELSITVLYFLLWSLTGVGVVWKNRRELLQNRLVWLVSLFVVLSMLSLFWTVNPLRGVLTCGIIGILWLIFLGILARKQQISKLLAGFFKVVVTSSVLKSLLAFGQFLAGIWLDKSATLLCQGCVIEQMGYVRPNVFMIEPQFFGNALLPAVFIISYWILSKKASRADYVKLTIILTALVLTMSRGAIFAFLAGLVVLLIFYARQWRPVGKLFLPIAVAFCLAFTAQGVSAEISPRVDETFAGATTKSIEQLTMGAVDISVEKPKSPAVAVETNQPTGAVQPAFDGYIAESTNTRLGLSKLALQTWSQNASTMLFGVGIGGAGVAMADFAPDKIDAKQIVQNEYVEVLLERGLVVLCLFVVLSITLFTRTSQQKWTWAIITAFILQWNFFSGYPNALHIYLLLIVFITLADNLELAFKNHANRP